MLYLKGLSVPYKKQRIDPPRDGLSAALNAEVPPSWDEERSVANHVQNANGIPVSHMHIKKSAATMK
jgi:hypothetical protein